MDLFEVSLKVQLANFLRFNLGFFPIKVELVSTPIFRKLINLGGFLDVSQLLISLIKILSVPFMIRIKLIGEFYCQLGSTFVWLKSPGKRFSY